MSEYEGAASSWLWTGPLQLPSNPPSCTHHPHHTHHTANGYARRQEAIDMGIPQGYDWLAVRFVADVLSFGLMGSHGQWELQP